MLEQCFAEYLGGALAKQPAYTANSGDYLHKLLNFGLSEIGALAYRSTVLNFNYTSPGNPLSAICDSIDFRNVHGHLGGEIVFGIDGTVCVIDLFRDIDVIKPRISATIEVVVKGNLSSRGVKLPEGER